jgi:hypothetical protein
MAYELQYIVQVLLLESADCSLRQLVFLSDFKNIIYSPSVLWSFNWNLMEVIGRWKIFYIFSSSCTQQSLQGLNLLYYLKHLLSFFPLQNDSKRILKKWCNSGVSRNLWVDLSNKSRSWLVRQAQTEVMIRFCFTIRKRTT